MALPLLDHDDDMAGDHFDAGRLLAQADALEARASSLKEQARELDREAIDLRVQADRMTREPLRTVPRPAPKAMTNAGARDARFMERVVDVLEGSGWLAMGDLTEHLSATPTRVRAALAALEAAGVVQKRGIKNATRYRVTDEEDDDAGEDASVAAFQSYEATVRDAAIRLDTFDFVDLQRELPDLSEPTLRRWLRELEEKGVFTSERVGHRKLYAYVPAEGGGMTNHPRYATPEAEASRMARLALANTPVAGTGRMERAGGSVVNALLREVRSKAPDVETKRTSHKIVFVRDGEEIAHCSKTPGASSLKTTRANLRKAGVPV